MVVKVSWRGECSDGGFGQDVLTERCGLVVRRNLDVRSPVTVEA